jgi:hypothetical protein
MKGELREKVEEIQKEHKVGGNWNENIPLFIQ